MSVFISAPPSYHPHLSTSAHGDHGNEIADAYAANTKPYNALSKKATQGLEGVERMDRQTQSVDLSSYPNQETRNEEEHLSAGRSC